MRSKKYLLYAIGEMLLTVVGILLALYINNRNINRRYKSRIDNNIVRVYDELEKNIDKTKKSIEQLQNADSLIYLVLNDSLKASDYHQGATWALIIQNHSLELEDNAYQNLIQLNNSDNRYRDELLTELKGLYSINKSIKEANQVLRNFVVEKSLPLFAKNVDSFVDLVYNHEIKDDAIKFYMTSHEYKLYVTQYAALAISNQLKDDLTFYKKAIETSDRISKVYNLENKNTSLFSQLIVPEYQGEYVNELTKDTLLIEIENDSLFVRNPGVDLELNLIPFKENRFILTQNTSQYLFISFFKNKNEKSDWNMRIHYYSHRREYIKQ